MNTFFSFDAATAWHVLGFAVDLGIKATVVLAVALAITWIARRRAAALRHRVWFLTYCGLLLLPVLPLALPKWQIPLPSAFQRFQPDVSHSLPVPPQSTPAVEPAKQNHPGSPLDPTFVASSRMENLSGPTDESALREAERGRSPESSWPRSSSITTPPSATAPMFAAAVPQPKRPPGSSAGLFLVALAAVWAAGVAVSLFGVLAGRRRGWKLLKSAEPVRDPRWLDLLEELRTNLRVSSRVRLLESPQAAVPMATGVVHLAVLLPCETEQWPAPLRRHVLIHELAHVKRRDVLQHLICRLAIALYWFHPLAWYGTRRMRLEREIACDDFVLMAGEHPCDYAAELVGIARQLHGIAMPWAVCMANVSTLEERVRAMLDRARSHGPLSVGAARSLLIVALAAIGLLAAVEPGSSSVREQEPASAGVVNEPVRAGQSSVKERPPAVDRTAGNTILAQADDKPPVVPVSTAPDSKDPTYSFAGTVVDQQGRPVPDARVSLSYFQAKPAAFELPAAVSDLHGRFEFSRKKSDFADLYPAHFWSDMRMVAVKQGFGFASVPATGCETTGRLAATIHELKNQSTWQTGGQETNVLTLVADDLPIRGRLLTVDGRPVSGAKIEVVGVWAGENGSLDAFEAKLKEGPFWQHVTALYRGYAQAGGMNYMGNKRWYRGAAAWNERRPSIVAPVQGDADGRFTITGLGRERMAEILIAAPGCETTLKFVRTRRGRVLPMGGGPNDVIHEQIEPSEFSLVLGPSVPIEGRVVDAKTRQPLAGVRVQPTSTVFAHAFSDAQGRYRMEALPLGDNNLEIIPPKGSRYLPGGVNVKTAAGAHRAIRDIALTAGVLVHGRVIDERTHQPVSGSVQYFAFESNPLLKNTDSLRKFVTWNKVAADAEGRFEIAALAGPGILGFEGARFKGAPGFPLGVGADRIQVPMRRAELQEFPTVPEYCRADEFNLVVPLNPRADERDFALDLKLRSGVDVPVHVVAFDGRPISAKFYAVRDGKVDFRLLRRDAGGGHAVSGYLPTQMVRLEAYDLERNLVGTYELTGPPPAMVTMTLHPGASFAGRILDEEGLPIPYAPVGCDRGRHATADAQGHFEIRGLLPGSKYSGWTPLMRGPGNRRQRDLFDLFTDVTAQKGEAKQLGDLRLKPRRMRTAKKRSDASNKQKTPKIASSQATPHDPKQADPATDKAPLSIAGRVLLPNGDPASGATVLVEGFINHSAGALVQWTLVAKFPADARGTFDRDLDGRWRPSDWSGIRLSAIMPGYGVSSVVQPSTNDMRSIVLQLADDAPIRARILNLEGRPIAGVRVEPVQVVPSKKEWIDRWLAAIPPNPIFAGIGGTTNEEVAQMKAVAHTAPLFPSARWSSDGVAGLRSAVTDADGKVELRGLGRERLVLLKVVGPGIAATKVYALTRATKPIEFNSNSGPVRNRAFSIYGSQFDYIAAPGIVVTGVVRDDETKKPISGAIVSSNALDGARSSLGGVLSTTTDNDGRYRLEGLSANRWLNLSVTRPNSAYVESSLEVRQSRRVEPIRQDISLTRGVWAVGRVYNIKTGQPVLATLFYTPFRSNEFAQKTRRNGVTNLLHYAPTGHTDPEGHFRIPVLPGRGLIALESVSGDYVPAFGAAKIKELSDRNRPVPTFDTFLPAWFDSVAEVDLKPDAAELRIDLPVDPGQDVDFKFVDRAGHRLFGMQVQGITPRLPLFTTTDTLTIPATSPDETRIGWVKHIGIGSTPHKDDGLCKFLHFKPLPGERERTITLEPPAVLTGRLVSPAGEPLRDVSIDCNYETGYKSLGGFPQVRTDAKGRFRYEIPGGGPFQLASRSGGFFSLARNLTVQSGEQVDFGELVVHVSDRVPSTVTPKNPPKRTLSPTADPNQKASTASKKLEVAERGSNRSASHKPQQVEPAADKSPLRIAGRVLDPSGKPVAGATVRIHAILGKAFDRAPYQSALLASVSTDESGRFEHSLDRDRIQLFKRSKYPFIRGVATKSGFGLAVKNFDVRGSAPPVDFQLVPDEPVRGRVLNLEGRPIAGARLEVVSLQRDTQTMKTLQQMEAARASGPVMWAPEATSPAMLPSAMTGGDGRFEIVGLGRDRLVGLRITGPQIAASLLHVATQPMKPFQIRLKWGVEYRFYGSQFEFVAEPSLPLEGAVKDEETGAPIAGAIVATYRFNGEMNLTDSDGLVFTTSDVQGRFKLEGLPLSDKNSVRIIPPDLPYLAADDLSVPRGNPPRPISHDIKLRRCVWAAGRVRDVKTGKPAIGQVFYTPFRSNEFAKRYSRYQKGFRNRLEQQPAGWTDNEGRFRIPVIPGRGVLCFRSSSYQEHYRPGNGAAAIKELAESKRKRNRVGPTFDDVDPPLFQAVCEINPPANAAQIEVDVPVDSGQDVVLKFVDRAGNRLTGLQSIGSGLLGVDLLPRGPGSDRAIVRATSAGETRSFSIKHEATGLTKLVHFRAKAGESERTITLEPPAVLTGRLVSADGHPLAGRSINCMVSGGPPVIELQRLHTDARGGFRCEIPGGGPFELYSYAVGYAGFAPLARNLTVQAGEQIDFGELVVNVGEDSMITVTAKNAQKRTMSPAAGPPMGNRP